MHQNATRIAADSLKIPAKCWLHQLESNHSLVCVPAQGAIYGFSQTLLYFFEPPLCFWSSRLPGIADRGHLSTVFSVACSFFVVFSFLFCRVGFWSMAIWALVSFSCLPYRVSPSLHAFPPRLFSSPLKLDMGPRSERSGHFCDCPCPFFFAPWSIRVAMVNKTD